MRSVFLCISFVFACFGGAAVIGAYCHWADFLAHGLETDRTLSALSSAGALVAGLGASAAYRLASFVGSERL